MKIQKNLLFKVRKDHMKDNGSTMGHEIVAICDRSNHNFPQIGEVVTIEEGEYVYTYLINNRSEDYGFVKLFDLEEHYTNYSVVRESIRQERQMILAWAHKEPTWESKLLSGKTELLSREEVAFFKRDNPNGHLEWIPIYLRWDDRIPERINKTREFYKKNYNIDIFKVEDVDK